MSDKPKFISPGWTAKINLSDGKGGGTDDRIKGLEAEIDRLRSENATLKQSHIEYEKRMIEVMAENNLLKKAGGRPSRN